MIAGFVLVYLERLFRKICPAVISMIVEPVCSLVPAVFIAHMVVGPIGWTIGNAIGDLVYAGLTSNIRFLFAGLFGLENNIYMQTGLIMIIGLLAKTAILLTEYAGKRRSEGMTLAQAAYSAAKVRLRPILMTTLTTIISMVPMMFSTDSGMGMMKDMAYVMAGGLVASTILAMFLMPAFYLLIRRENVDGT